MEEQKISTSKKQPTRIATIALIVAGFLAGWPTLAQALYPYQDANLAVEDRVNDLLPRMDINEKVGQMTQALSSISQASITTYRIGSILSGGNDGPGGNNSAAEWVTLYNSLQARALATR